MILSYHTPKLNSILTKKTYYALLYTNYALILLIFLLKWIHLKKI